jgi:hypothetical protein
MDNKQIKKIMVKQNLQSELKITIDQRVERYMEIDHQGIVGGHHFADASSECINLYRDGYFISAVMVSQAVNEGIMRFIAERNGIDLHPNNDKGKTKDISTLIDEFEEKNIISHNCAEASRGIYKSFRNDVHHMNPNVADIPFQQLAKRNLQDLATVEKELFGVDIKDGKFAPHQPKYWDIGKDGTAPVFLRLE